MVSGSVSPTSTDAELKTGLNINGNVLFAMNDMLGREILVITKHKRYTGILSAISPNFELGLRKVVEITEANKTDLIKKHADIIEKMIISFDDVIEFSCVHKPIRKTIDAAKFSTDKVYHGRAPLDTEALQEWSGGEDGDGTEMSIEDSECINPQPMMQHARRSNQNNGTGWSVDDMFAVNEKMNVVSTFKSDLTQYTTAEIIGTDEDRARADRLAREIESSQSSKFYANLENDDIERDLDKTTKEDDFEFGSNQRRGKGNNSFNQQQRRNPNITPNGQPVNKRAEGLRSDRRNSGSSSANNSRYGPPSQPQNYQPQQGSKGNYNNRRQNEEYRDNNDWQMAKGKGQNPGHDQSFRHQQKQMLDPRPSAKQPSNEGEKSQGTSSRVADLKTWGTGFDLANSPKDQSPAPQGASSSAWNRGPPSSLVSKGSSTESTPPPQAEGEDVGSTPSVDVASSSETTQKKEEQPSTSGEDHDESDGKASNAENNSSADASDASSNATSKSALFKFNINAPEFKPRVAPTTPTPTTPNGPMSQNANSIPQQQYISQEYQQQSLMGPQGGPGAPIGMPGMIPHMAQGVVPQNQGQPIMMWAPQGQQQFAPNQQFPIQQIPIAGVPGQMYGTAANAPVTAHQAGNQQVPTSVAGGVPQDARQGVPQQRREGEFRDPATCYYPYTNNGPVPMPFYPQQYQQGMQPGQYPMKMVQQQAPQGGFQQRYPAPQMYIPPGVQPRYAQHQPQQPQQQFGGEQQGGPQSHPNSQPTTPGPRGEQNMGGGKGQQAQNGNNNMGMHREPEGGSNASLSGSASSQSGQRSGSPPNNVAPPPQQQHQAPQQGPVQGGPMAQGPMVGMQQAYVQMMHPQMHGQHPHYYPQQQQQGMFYPQNVVMVPQPMHPNHHAQPSMMGEQRSEQGYPNSNYFDFRNMPPFQQQQQQHQMHGGHMSRQNSLPQQFSGNAQQVLKV